MAPLRAPSRHRLSARRAPWWKLAACSLLCVWLGATAVFVRRGTSQPPAAATRLARSFRPVAAVETAAASGVAAFADASGAWYLALSNYYAASALYSFDPSSLSLHEAQTFLSRQAHDWEVIRHVGGWTQLFLCEAAEERSIVYTLNDSAAPPQVWRATPWSDCRDSEGVASRCREWSESGECERNGAFMHANCAASCGRCGAARGPLVAVQQLPVASASASRHFFVGRRLFLAITERHQVSVYEWHAASTQWSFFTRLESAGMCEVSHVQLPRGGHLLAFARWYAGGSFVGHSAIYHFSPDADPPLRLMQEVPSRGAHDVEFFRTKREGAQTSPGPGAAASTDEVWLLVANARDEASQHVMSDVYRLNESKFELVQSIPTSGAHDWEPMHVDGRLVFAVANQGDGTSCSTEGGVVVFAYDNSELRALESIPTGGCTVFARSFTAAGRTFLAVATEREGDDPQNTSTYRTKSQVFLWQ